MAETASSSTGSTSIDRVSDALVDVVSVNYGGRLSQGQLAEIRIEIQNQLAVSERLRRYPLTNADEPAFGFAAYDGER